MTPASVADVFVQLTVSYCVTECGSATRVDVQLSGSGGKHPVIEYNLCKPSALGIHLKCGPSSVGVHPLLTSQPFIVGPPAFTGRYTPSEATILNSMGSNCCTSKVISYPIIPVPMSSVGKQMISASLTQHGLPVEGCEPSNADEATISLLNEKPVPQ